MKKKSRMIMPAGFIHNHMAWLSDAISGRVVSDLDRPASQKPKAGRATRAKLAKSHAVPRKVKQAAKAAN